MVRYPEQFRDSVTDIRNILLTAPGGEQVPLGSLAHIELREGLSQIKREMAKRRIVIGVNVQDQAVSGYLKQFHKDAGFTQYIEIDKADAKTLARLAEFVSQSISAQSQALGSGGASPALVF